MARFGGASSWEAGSRCAISPSKLESSFPPGIRWLYRSRGKCNEKRTLAPKKRGFAAAKTGTKKLEAGTPEPGKR
jgi:hypothetical protein